MLYNEHQIFPRRTEIDDLEFCSFEIEAIGEDEETLLIPMTIIELGGELISSIDIKRRNDSPTLRQEMIEFFATVSKRPDVTIQMFFMSEYESIDKDWDIHNTFLNIIRQHPSIKHNISKYHLDYVISKWDTSPYRNKSVKDVLAKYHKKT